MTASPADILVVDDNPHNLLALEATLADPSTNLVKASSGGDALKQLLDRDFALVLLDIQMPGMNGFETAAMIRARDRLRHLPIMFVTAFGRSDEQVRRAYELGAVDFLWKPIVPEILKSKVAVFLDLYRNREEVRRQAALLAQATERVRGEALRTAELAESARHKDEFLAMLGHELRNPLAPILNAVQLMKLRPIDDPVIAKSRDVMDRQVRHMVRLLDDLLDVARINSGKIELRKDACELGAIVDHAVQTSQAAIRARNHELSVALPAERIALVADATRLAQVVSNLLNNAARYTEPGGRIWLEAVREDADIVLRVRDTGRGIRADLLPKIFDLFVQSERTAERRGGLGVGLTLVRRLTELHGGSVAVRSPGPGAGSEFTVRLPIHAPDAPGLLIATGSTPPTNGRAAKALRVLVIDDSPDIRDTLRDLLESCGHEVAVAEDGVRGVEVALAVRPDVALVDIGLPGLDGYGVARSLRAREGASGPRLIALTGYGQPDDRRRALEAGFDAHLVKPVYMDALTRALFNAPDERTTHVSQG